MSDYKSRIGQVSFDNAMLHQVKGLPVNLLVDLLKAMPAGTTFTGVVENYNTNLSHLRFTSPAFREIDEAERIPEITAHFARDPDGDPRFVKLDLSEVLPQNNPTNSASTACVNHVWKEYLGITDRYNYCAHCGKKE